MKIAKKDKINLRMWEFFFITISSKVLIADLNKKLNVIRSQLNQISILCLICFFCLRKIQPMDACTGAFNNIIVTVHWCDETAVVAEMQRFNSAFNYL